MNAASNIEILLENCRRAVSSHDISLIRNACESLKFAVSDESTMFLFLKKGGLDFLSELVDGALHSDGGDIMSQRYLAGAIHSICINTQNKPKLGKHGLVLTIEKLAQSGDERVLRRCASSFVSISEMSEAHLYLKHRSFLELLLKWEKSEELRQTCLVLLLSLSKGPWKEKLIGVDLAPLLLSGWNCHTNSVLLQTTEMFFHLSTIRKPWDAFVAASTWESLLSVVTHSPPTVTVALECMVAGSLVCIAEAYACHPLHLRPCVPVLAQILQSNTADSIHHATLFFSGMQRGRHLACSSSSNNSNSSSSSNSSSGSNNQPPLGKEGRLKSVIEWRSLLSADVLCSLFSLAVGRVPDRHCCLDGTRALCTIAQMIEEDDSQPPAVWFQMVSAWHQQESEQDAFTIAKWVQNTLDIDLLNRHHLTRMEESFSSSERKPQFGKVAEPCEAGQCSRMASLGRMAFAVIMSVNSEHSAVIPSLEEEASFATIVADVFEYHHLDKNNSTESFELLSHLCWLAESTHVCRFWSMAVVQWIVSELEKEDSRSLPIIWSILSRCSSDADFMLHLCCPEGSLLLQRIITVGMRSNFSEIAYCDDIFSTFHGLSSYSNPTRALFLHSGVEFLPLVQALLSVNDGFFWNLLELWTSLIQSGALAKRFCSHRGPQLAWERISLLQTTHTRVAEGYAFIGTLFHNLSTRSAVCMPSVIIAAKSWSESTDMNLRRIASGILCVMSETASGRALLARTIGLDSMALWVQSLEDSNLLAHFFETVADLLLDEKRVMEILETGMVIAVLVRYLEQKLEKGNGFADSASGWSSLSRLLRSRQQACAQSLQQGLDIVAAAIQTILEGEAGDPSAAAAAGDCLCVWYFITAARIEMEQNKEPSTVLDACRQLLSSRHLACRKSGVKLLGCVLKMGSIETETSTSTAGNTEQPSIYRAAPDVLRSFLAATEHAGDEACRWGLQLKSQYLSRRDMEGVIAPPS
jgi:hypothetical protein